MISLPLFREDPISDAEHEACLRTFGLRYFDRVLPIVSSSSLCPRGRMTPGDGAQLYVFRSPGSARKNRGVVFHLQRTPDDGCVEVAFRPWKDGTLPVTPEVWQELGPDSRRPGRTGWRGFRVETREDVSRAIGMAETAAERFDQLWGK
ncbi:MAG: hypothetical protein QF819_00470 [Gemmatimonadota bacterium]|jgi:hypothetical protein|nr:hypothetical protein [Gemmatimonadota bacterium]MDP6529075.1 hypothetical protein [Gemmatimonadota bacterium]MDP6801638.1 hypothetical protein [Gemmatimonadota bacterium]MDP7030815.1 hypothetical protein [Gemmatimonadota bacterium]